MKATILSILGAVVAMTMAVSASAGTLDDVRKRGHLQWGVNTGAASISIIAAPSPPPSSAMLRN